MQYISDPSNPEHNTETFQNPAAQKIWHMLAMRRSHTNQKVVTYNLYSTLLRECHIQNQWLPHRQSTHVHCKVITSRKRCKIEMLLGRVVVLVSTSRRLETYQRLVSVSSRRKLSTSRSRPLTSRAQDQFFRQILQVTIIKLIKLVVAVNESLAQLVY